jgi:hypothetical protein
MAGQCHLAVFQAGLAALLASHRARTLEPRLLRQLFQAVARARAVGIDVVLPPEVEKIANKCALRYFAWSAHACVCVCEGGGGMCVWSQPWEWRC